VTESDVGVLLDVPLGSRHGIEVAGLLNIYGPEGDRRLKGMAQVMKILGTDKSVARQVGLSNRLNPMRIGDRVKVLSDVVGEGIPTQEIAEPVRPRMPKPEQPVSPNQMQTPSMPEVATVSGTSKQTHFPPIPVKPVAPLAPVAPLQPSQPEPIVAVNPRPTAPSPEFLELEAKNATLQDQLAKMAEDQKRTQALLERLAMGSAAPAPEMPAVPVVRSAPANTPPITKASDLYDLDLSRTSDSHNAKKPHLTDAKTVAALDQVAAMSSELDQVKRARERLDADLLSNRKQIDELYAQLAAQELARLEAERALYDFSVRVLQLTDKSAETMKLQQRLRQYLAYIETHAPTDEELGRSPQ
jgi:hypothetical protein